MHEFEEAFKIASAERAPESAAEIAVTLRRDNGNIMLMPPRLLTRSVYDSSRYRQQAKGAYFCA